MEMDLDFDPSGIAGGDAPDVEDVQILGDVTIEGERCGICMDVVIDRGVIDCCQHWYCFTCIDNWASITNLCPLCQNEFQLITCVPVYDTIRSNKVEDENLSREDEWCIEGQNNTLSFPSYYIDENAVICLDGDACKMRDGSASVEDPSLDTSIACDSCDIWYHAFCVGFDPEGTSESTWLCPRCVVDKAPTDTKMGTVIHCGPEHANSTSQFDNSSRKVSVCVADSGETALVISMHGALDGAQMPSENALPPPQIEKDHMNEALLPIPNEKSKDAGMASMIVTSDMEEQELNLSMSQKFSILPSDGLAHTKSNSTDPEEINNSSGSRGILNSSAKFSSESEQMPGQSESELSLHPGLTVVSILSDDDMNKDAEDCVAVVQQGNPSEELLRGNQKVLDVDDNAKVTGEKWGHTSSNQVYLHDGDMIPAVVTEDCQKKPKFEGSPLKTSADDTDADVLNMSPGNTICEDEKLKPHSKTVEVTPDIMRIVEGTNRRRPKVLASSNACNLSSKECEAAAGFRLKKIMRRAAINEDSSILVQNLRNEIREAVLKKCNNFEENVFDPKLLVAFRAAMGGATSEPVNKLSTSALKSKKLMLRKGKVRENLTKKLYGNSNGRRKRAWDRDCEVEFWKYRCKRATKPEKIETLKSVLHFLSKNSKSLELKQESEFEATSPILDRLYLADTSVFPKKDVIPLAAVASSLELSIENNQGPKASFEHSTSKSSEAKKISSKMGAYSPECKVNMKIESGLATKPASGNVHQLRTMVGGSVSWTSGDKGGKEESGVLSVDVKSDRRKWALQVLARQAANAGGKKTGENQQDNTLFKGNYPLLTQLPADMRPILASTHHNKIPLSVRQTQLYRLTEHFLRNANLPEICRTAETELAVADAVNIEKKAADRSNSKLVYLNLCSQELLHHSSKSNFDQATDMNPYSKGSLSERSEQRMDEFPFNPAVEEALKNAGLLSDSPPASPIAKSETDTDSNYLSGPGNLLEMDSRPELDIYGDFEYELEDEDYIGASKARVLNQKSESVPKMKVLFSTMNVNKPNDAVDAVESEGLDDSDIQINASLPLSCGNDTGNGIFTLDGKPDKSIVLEEALPGGGAEEPSDAECRELYGPDKEPTVNDFKHWQSVMPNEASQATDAYEKGDEKLAESSSAVIISHNSSGVEVSHDLPHTGENLGREENKSDTCKHLKCVNSVSKKVEAYIKEHVRPLCKSGVITAEQYRWAVSKTTDKVMKYHSKSKNANFLIKEGEKVKKLAEQYVEAAQQNCKGD